MYLELVYISHVLILKLIQKRLYIVCHSPSLHMNGKEEIYDIKIELEHAN